MVSRALGGGGRGEILFQGSELAVTGCTRSGVVAVVTDTVLCPRKRLSGRSVNVVTITTTTW